MFKNLENKMSRIGEQKGNFNRETENLIKDQMHGKCQGNTKKREMIQMETKKRIEKKLNRISVIHATISSNLTHK